MWWLWIKKGVILERYAVQTSLYNEFDLRCALSEDDQLLTILTEGLPRYPIAVQNILVYLIIGSLILALFLYMPPFYHSPTYFCLDRMKFISISYLLSLLEIKLKRRELNFS